MIPPVATSGSSTCAPHELQQRQQADAPPARVVVEAAAMPAGLGALHDERVGARRVGGRAPRPAS